MTYEAMLLEKINKIQASETDAKLGGTRKEAVVSKGVKSCMSLLH